MGYYYSDEYLQHHGIKGQKWGVRRFQNHDGTRIKPAIDDDSDDHKKGLTEEQKRALKIGAIAVASTLAAVGTVYVFKKGMLNNRVAITEYKFGKELDTSKLSNESITIGKDTPLQRLSTKSAEDYVKEGASIYASYLKSDNAIYKERMPDYFKRWEKAGIVDSSSSYVHKLKLKRDIKIASEKDVADAYMKANKTDSIDMGRYQRFMENLVDRDNPLVKEFYNELKNKGCDGIIDMNDTGSGFTKAPIIIFDPADVISSSSSHKLSKVERFINVLTYSGN